VDNAGNWSDWVDDGWCKIDIVAPEITNYEPKDGAILKGQVTVSFSAKDDTSELDNEYPQQIIINGIIDKYTDSYSWNTTQYSDGNYDISYIAVDKAGNETEKDITVTVDNTAPGCSVVCR
jgi:chitodextrinase